MPRTDKQTNRQTDKQTDRQRIQIQRPLLSPVDRWGERANTDDIRTSPVSKGRIKKLCFFRTWPKRDGSSTSTQTSKLISSKLGEEVERVEEIWPGSEKKNNFFTPSLMLREVTVYQLIPICSAPHLKINFTEMRGAELCEDITILCQNLMKTRFLA